MHLQVCISTYYYIHHNIPLNINVKKRYERDTREFQFTYKLELQSTIIYAGFMLQDKRLNNYIFTHKLIN